MTAPQRSPTPDFAMAQRELMLQVEKELETTQLTTPVAFAGLFHLPAIFYPGFVTNPSIHPRGQLAAFLRLRGSGVPAMYGRSADEPWNS